MAKFTAEQATSAVAIQQLIHDWANELDQNDGLQIEPLITEDCAYNVGGELRHSRAEVIEFYKQRRARLAATEQGVPLMRHAISTLRVQFADATSAEVTFGLIFFMGFGKPPITNMTGPTAVADVTMKVRQDADGEWKIASFDSWQPFRAGA